MRILHLGKYLPPHPGGIERFLAELMPAQRRLGLQPAALVHAEPGARPPWLRRQAAAVTLRAPVLGRLAFTPLSPSWPCRMHRLIRRWCPDILHLHLPNPSAFAALTLPAARRLPWVVHWHADVPADALDWRLRLLYRVYRPLESAVLRRAAAILATSQAYAASSAPLQRWQDKLSVVPLGIADHVGAKPQAQLWPTAGVDDDLRVLFVGRFSYYKGLPHLLDAVAATPGIRLLLIGEGDQEPALHRQAARLGLEHRIRFAGAVDDEILAGAYAGADLLVLPSIERSEAFGMVLLEAMRAGCPCLATRVPGSGMREVLADGAAGALVDPGDSAGLTAALAQLRDDKSLRTRLGAAGRQRFQSHYRIDQVAMAMQGVYAKVLESR